MNNMFTSLLQMHRFKGELQPYIFTMIKLSLLQAVYHHLSLNYNNVAENGIIAHEEVWGLTYD